MLFLLTIFLSAFLLFQVQPLIAKMILPLFGGGAAVWTSCLLFFQVFLLLGYLYAHALTKLSSVKKQLLVHGTLLLACLAFLPMTTIDLEQTLVASSPLWQIVLLLLSTVGLPYFMLSSTAPLVQRWFSYSQQQKLPYGLYAYSNAGSLLALLSYPFLIEPNMVLSNQTVMWSVGFVILVCCFALLGWGLTKHGRHLNVEPRVTSSNSVKSPAAWVWAWVSLSFVGVVLLISTTNAMTQNVPPMPFLWILPLCLYLLSFIISFHSPRWYVRWYWFVLFSISSFAAVLMFFIGTQFDILSQIGLYSLILMSSCMICHGELARLKPDVEQLTLYYLYIALGGALASVFVSVLAPSLFDLFYEFPLAILCVYILFAWCLRLNHSALEGRSIGALLGLSQLSVLKGAGTLCLALVAVTFFMLNHLFAQYDVARSRNFYGILSVKDVTVDGQTERRLIDGTTSHGTQSQQEHLQMQPLSYYRRNTGGALVLQHLSPGKPIKAGLIGLGAGALAAYGKKGDEYQFYELNPDVYQMAKQYFSFLDKSKANVQVALGDGRVSLASQLKQNGSKQFDVLVVDAFSGDSIPSHLLTREAFELYFRHLSDEGILALHISNSHLELAPLVRGLAKSVSKPVYYFNLSADTSDSHSTQWVLMGNNTRFFTNPLVSMYLSSWPKSRQDDLIWSDDYSNLFSVLKW